jgi:hypothetical protein
VLIYETDDPHVAAQCIDALNQAGIDGYRTGGPLATGRSDPRICLHIRDPADDPKANQILVNLGAAVTAPLRLPSRPVIFLAVVVITPLAILVAISGK